jgi:hypothetical protein
MVERVGGGVLAGREMVPPDQVAVDARRWDGWLTQDDTVNDGCENTLPVCYRFRA